VRCEAPNEYERLVEGRSSMFVRTDERPMLQQNGFVRFRDFMTCPRGEVVNGHHGREVVRMELNGEGGPRTVFLKRFGPVDRKDALKDLLCFRRVRTKALAEFDMLCAFAEAALAVPGALACGERHLMGRDRASFLMVEGLASGRPLDEVLSGLSDSGRRRRLISSLAVFVRRMHNAGLTHADLFAKHLFVEESRVGTWSVAVIDLQRAERRSSLSRRRRGRDLAALLVSLPPDVTTPRERLTFLLEYLQKSRLDRKDRAFVRRAVLPRARKFSRRTVYRSWQPILEHM